MFRESLIDSHIHVGQYYDYYFSPFDVHDLMEKSNVSHYAVSSTTQCEHNYQKVLEEFHELLSLDGEKVLPVMWITPDALEGNIAWYLESEIKWKMLKIHPFLNKSEWHPDGKMFEEVLEIARFLDLPILIHTGMDDCCKADLFEKALILNEDLNFIFAHGNPLDSTLRLVEKYHNAYADSAFMTIDNMSKFLENKLYKKLLWGTDMFIPKFFHPDLNMEVYYTLKLSSLKRICPIKVFEYVTYKNAKSIFKIE